MPDLAQSLGNYDPGYLQIVAQSWGIDYSAQDLQMGIHLLVPLMADQQRLNELLEVLPGEAKSALADLLSYGGRMTWSNFTRRFGEVREMGAGRRDRDRPDLDPVSTAEILFYRALIGRAFFETPDGPQEHAYIPDDLKELMNLEGEEVQIPFGRAALPEERAQQYPVSDHILDDACTVLAALRMGLPENQVPLSIYPGDYQPSMRSLTSLLKAAGLLDKSGTPIPEAVRKFLEIDRGQALAQLALAWLQSKQLNELALLPNLILEGEWINNPFRTRQAILTLLGDIPAGTWWGLESFINAVRDRNPDFQRPAGDYDSWIIRIANTETYLSGFGSWDQVDGQLLRLVITGFFHWLGFLDLAAPGKDGPVTAFRFTDWSGALLQGDAPPGLPVDDQKMIVRSDGRLVFPRRVQRSVRYQVSRFCEWDGLKRGEYLYQITPSSLKRAEEHGLLIGQLLALLRKHSEQVPPNLVTALEGYKEHGRQARIEQVQVLRLNSPEILEELRSSRAARFLGDPLGPTTVIVKPGAQEKVLAALVEMGYLGEILD
ncbi:MAG: helicase-associated domain-containing protein, partial [Anaerolineales bacterium]